MLQSIVGPPVKGVADLVPSERAKAGNLKDTKNAGSDSFGEVLGAKVDSPPREIRKKEASSGESDKKTEKRTATNDEGDEKKTSESSQRQKAILKFMDSFESEFGVPPTRIVEAMANLDTTQQAESPEETAELVIDQLDLDDQDTDQAKNMYMGLLSQLAQIEKTPTLPVKPAAAAMVSSALTQERFVSGQEKRNILNQSLDTMNEKFWMKGGTAGQVMGAPPMDLADKIAQLSLQEKLGQPQEVASLAADESSFASAFNEQLPGIQNESTQQSPEAALAALVAAARAMKSQGTEADPLSDEEPTVESQEVTDTLKVTGASQEILQGPETAEQQKGFESFQRQHQPQEGLNTPKGLTAAKGELFEKVDVKDQLSTDGTLQSQGHPSLGLKQDFALSTGMTGAVAGAGTNAGAAIPTQGESPANVQQIMNQAQYLIKKGGGEMKVQMSPEGMGQIHMKVLVENGKVNVQMATETQEAKKSLESGLSDLKNSLAAHKLSMDHVKIDVVNATQTENNTQNQMNQDSASREQARQFWNRFGDNFGSPSQHRQGFADIPSMRGYPRKRTDQPLEPIRSASVNNYAGVNKGKGLNLVA